MKKVLVLFITLAIFFSFTACTTKTKDETPQENETSAVTTTSQKTTKGTTTKEKTTKKAEQTTTETINPLAEKMEISWLVGTYNSHLYEEGRWDELELEEKFNVDIKMWNIRIDSSNMEEVDMMLAAGDVPDYGFYYRWGKYLYENGLARTIPLEMIKQFYPSYYRHFKEDPIGLLFNRIQDKEDENYGDFYGLPLILSNSNDSSHMPMWRLDWLEELGYQLNNLVPIKSYAFPEWSDRVYLTTTHFSTDDVKELLRAFTEDDPDGNGVDDTYGSAFSNTWYDCYISYCMFGFDTNGNYMYQDPVTEDYVPYFAYTPYRDMLEFLTEMIDKEYIRRVPGEEAYWQELMAIWASGKTGFINALGQGRILGYWDEGKQWPPQSVLANDKDAKLVITKAPGSGKYKPYDPFSWSATMDYPVGINVSDKKLERLFQLLEYSYFGEKWTRYKWGIEGVHYKWADEPFKSPIIFTPEDKIPKKYAGLGTTKGFGQFGNINFVSDYKAYYDYESFIVQLVDFWNTHHPDGYYADDLWIYPDKLYSPITMSDDQYKEFEEIRIDTIDDINTVRNDFTSRVWEGQISDINTEWETYIEQIYSSGLKEWVEFFNNDEVKTLEYFKNK